jgi:hypothetical protein
MKLKRIDIMYRDAPFETPRKLHSCRNPKEVAHWMAVAAKNSTHEVWKVEVYTAMEMERS